MRPSSLHSDRIDLIPLTAAQLLSFVERPEELEKELRLPLSRAVVTDRVRRAIRMKLEKMESADPARHPWFTYWLLVVREAPFGAGLLGFKGGPGPDGEVEIGYGIDPGWQGRGYATEAVKRLIAWAFEEKDCRTVTTRDILKSNLASRRVSEKAGLTPYAESEEGISYKIDRE